VDDKAHATSSSSIWDRLNQQSDIISEVVRAQATTEANLAALAEAMRSGFDQVNTNLNRVNDRENRPTNWIGLGGLVIVVITTMIAFNSLTTQPVREEAAKNAERIHAAFQRELEHATEYGEYSAKLAMVISWQERQDVRLHELETFQKNAEYFHGKQEELADRVRDIDNIGSRRWFQREPAGE